MIDVSKLVVEIGKAGGEGVVVALEGIRVECIERRMGSGGAAMVEIDAIVVVIDGVIAGLKAGK